MGSLENGAAAPNVTLACLDDMSGATSSTTLHDLIRRAHPRPLVAIAGSYS